MKEDGGQDVEVCSIAVLVNFSSDGDTSVISILKLQVRFLKCFTFF